MSPVPRHLIRSQQFDRPLLESLFSRADVLASELTKPDTRAKLAERYRQRLLFNVFYEPSTRTRMSFAAAAGHLGMQVVATENAQEFSSAAKGETLEDAIRVLSAYQPDVIVLRHFENGAAARAAKVSSVPIINAGDGAGQHPTQALLDVYTIQHEKGSLDGLTVVIGGDLANGRTARSLIYLLTKFERVKIRLAAPYLLRLGDDIKAYLDKEKVDWQETENPAEVLADGDVIYWTRVQRERFADPGLYQQVKDAFIFGADQLNDVKKDAIIMHPLPRVNEIAPEVDTDSRSVYFRQAGNGVVVRMAALEWVLGV